MGLLVSRLGVVSALLFGLHGTLALGADVFSPGDLSRAHAALQGINRCGSCHPQGGQLAASSCLECHTDIGGRAKTGKGLHGKMPKSELNTCWTCHHEHQGRDFTPIDWGRGGMQGFDHRRTGWPLNGKHASQGCGNCHETRRMVDKAVIKRVNEQSNRRTFLGLSTTCSDCHFDEHRAQVGQLCRNCHTEQGWKPAPGFDHDHDSAFPLLGKHEEVKCSGCHPPLEDKSTPADLFPQPVRKTHPQFAGIDHQTCGQCHKDPHKGEFGESCDSCHTEKGWKIIGGTQTDRAFHQTTRFPLRGRHMRVDCKACHGAGKDGQLARLKGLAFGSCNDCHADAHLGQLDSGKRGRGPDCDSCHTEAGFLASMKFTLARHDKTGYPLVGAHRAVSCLSCHEDDNSLLQKIPAATVRELKSKGRPFLFSLARFHFPSNTMRCESCHRDEHAGQFPPSPNGCLTCHKLASFKDLNFDHDRDTDFRLTGKHASTACGSCHRPEQIQGTTTARYRPMAQQTCAECHRDVHVGQFADASKKQTACERCHGTNTFKPAEHFKHEPPFTSFLLDGAHSRAACRSCHPPVSVDTGVTATYYKPLPATCAGCHVDVHKGEFRRMVR